MCLNPKWIYKKGFYKENNYRGEKGQFYELGTYSKCGHCQVCINEKSNNWAIRNHYEEKTHDRKCFITLTYEKSPLILVKKDLQDWLKRFRIALDRTTGEKIRFFAAGEYGDLHGRPHFHVLIYGWDDINARYIGINKKGNILYQSKLVQDTWGLGRTSYQKFVAEEIPYTALYATPKEEFAKAYKLSMAKLKKLDDMKYSMSLPKGSRENLNKQLKEIREELETNKKKFTTVKEFNTWSKSLGWEEFERQYNASHTACFTEYIGDKEFATPSPWVKRLANMGDVNAIFEMYKREEMIIQSESEEEERIKNQLKVGQRKKQEILDWDDEKTKITETL